MSRSMEYLAELMAKKKKHEILEKEIGTACRRLEHLIEQLLDPEWKPDHVNQRDQYLREICDGLVNIRVYSEELL